jgi:hypothetical protein
MCPRDVAQVEHAVLVRESDWLVQKVRTTTPLPPFGKGDWQHVLPFLLVNG